MEPDEGNVSERTSLLTAGVNNNPRLPQRQNELDEEAQSTISSTVTKEEQRMAGSTVGERLPYNDYTTIDWLHDLVKDSYRFRHIQSRKGLRFRLISAFEACQGWTAVIVIGSLTACVAFVVDVAVATVSDWKVGYCRTNPFLSKEACCTNKTPLLFSKLHPAQGCSDFRLWTDSYAGSFAIYVTMALAFGVISSSATMLTKSNLPAAPPENNAKDDDGQRSPGGKVMYMAAGSGIPEIKTILSGFVIPNFLSLQVLIIKAFGAIFAVATGYLVGTCFPKYRDNGRKLRELLSAACASGLSVAFGAPIGGVLFSLEEISTYFPRKVLWRAFLCSLFAAIVLKALNPTGTGKLVLFETGFGTDYKASHYLVFVVLGVAGGVFGGLFCKLNFLWSKWFRTFPIIKSYPVFEVFLVVLATALLQFPNPLTREPGDVIIKNLLVDCESLSTDSWVCENEKEGLEPGDVNWPYIGYLIYGTIVKLVLTIITFGAKPFRLLTFDHVPSGVIIPALDAGALFGRLIGQTITSISPGIFAMVGAAAFLAGVSRMTISLAVIMFELTGELSYVVPHMIAIMVAKWVADSISEQGVYDLAQTVLGHPFLDPDTAIHVVRMRNLLVEELIPPKRTMEEITVVVPPSNKVPQSLLRRKLEQLHGRGLMDAGLVLVQTHSESSTPILQGYISQSELEFGLTKLCSGSMMGGEQTEAMVRVLGHAVDGDDAESDLEVDLTPFVDRTPLSICAKAPLEYAVEMFSKLGLRYLCVTEEGTGALVGVIIKKRLVGFLEHLKEEGNSVSST